MTKPDYGMAGVLALLAAVLWLQALSWTRAAADTLPILVGLPLFVWLNRPWKFTTRAWELASRPALIGLVLFPIGSLLGSTLVLTAGWTALLWSWISTRTSVRDNPSASKLLVLAFLSFPWILTDLEGVGWWFRLSGAAVAERLLAWCQLDVARQGTYLSVAGFTLSVEPACSGLNGLEAMLIAGAALAYGKLGRTRLYWWNLPLLVAAAWAANLMRIVFTALWAIGLTGEEEIRRLGQFHLVVGWLALCVVFGLCWVLFSVQERLTRQREGSRTARPIRWPRLEMVLLAYCGWRSAGLVGAWLDSPFDRLGWLAFLIWLLPLAVQWRGRNLWPHQSEARKLWLMGTGLALTFLGDLVDINFSHHLGLVLVLMSFAPRRCTALWGASLIAWLPASGWVGSRFGFDPTVFAFVRVATAVLGSALVLLGMSRLRTGRASPGRDILDDTLVDSVAS